MATSVIITMLVRRIPIPAPILHLSLLELSTDTVPHPYCLSWDSGSSQKL